jgi:hypothetical protein
MEATTMCTMGMMMRLSKTMLVVMRSVVLSMNKRTTFAKSPNKCPYETGRIAIIHNNSVKTLIM